MKIAKERDPNSAPEARKKASKQPGATRAGTGRTVTAPYRSIRWNKKSVFREPRLRTAIHENELPTLLLLDVLLKKA